MRPSAFLPILIALVALLLPHGAAAESSLSDNPTDRRSTIPHDEELAQALRESGIRSIAVRHEGWNETLYTWSRLKVYQLTGRQRIAGQDPVFTTLSMMYEPEAWMNARFLPVEHPRVAEILGAEGKWMSPSELVHNPRVEVMRTELAELLERRNERDDLKEVLDAVHQVRSIGPDRPGVYDTVVTPEVDRMLVQLYVRDSEMRTEARQRLRQLNRQVRQDRAYLEAGLRMLDRAILARQLPQEFLIIPDPDARHGEWMAARDAAARGEAWQIETASIEPAAMPRPLTLTRAATELDVTLTDLFQARRTSGLAESVERFLSTANEARYYPDAGYLARKNFYIQYNPTRNASWVYGLSIIFYGLFFFFRSRPWLIAGTSVLGVGLAMHTFGQVLRMSLTGYMPVSNMYESIVFASWAAMAIGLGLELWKRSGVLGLAAAVVGFIALIGVSLMPLHDTRIHPLRAVLNSYWLNIHVTAMLISYGAFMVATICAAGYLIKSYTGREALFGGTPLIPSVQLEELAYRLVQIGWPILTLGVLLGALWADEAWGRFWGWDPKETWALITWIAYTIYLHTRMVLGWKGRISAIACIIGFVMLLITWIGVSYIPWFAGGLHTYASPT